MDKVSLIIPSFNGRGLLKRNLPGVVEAAETAGNSEVIVVDDGSTDGSRQWLEDEWQGRVRLLYNNTQRGFISSVNMGVKRSGGEMVLLLNSDVRVEPDFIAPLVDALDERTFAVSCCSLTNEGHNEGLSAAFYEDGDLVVVQPGVEMPDTAHDRRCTNFHASGGFSLFSRAKWLELGGLNPIYHPFYWEDVDLCFRAWKRGWRCIYEPESRVHHQPHSTISCYFDQEEIKKIYEGNKHTFILKNISDPVYFAAYVRQLGRDLFAPPSSPDEQRKHWGAFEMLKRARAAMALRGEQAKVESAYTDAEVFTRSANIPC